jgi:hypothetical protein
MQVATIRGAAVIGLSLFIGVGLTGMAHRASGSGGLRSCTAASYCAPTPRDCTFPGPDSIAPVVVADFPDGVSSDGRGPYLKGKDGVIDSRAGKEGALTIWVRTDTVRNVRTFTVNLSKPVPGGGGVPLGINTAGNKSGFVTQRGMVGDTVLNLIGIAVGRTETAALMSVTFHVNGRRHVLQMGPQANGHCMDAGDGMTGRNLVHGTGTSSGTIFRASRTKWVMDLPAGSVGRLFDMQDSWDHAVDKGLYYVHLHYEIGH